LIFTNIGVFLSPTLINYLSSFLGNSQPDMNMRVCAFGFAALFVVSNILLIYQKVFQGGKAIVK